MKRLAAILLLAGCTYVPEPQQGGDSAAAIWAFYADEVDDAEVSVALVRDGIPTFAGDPKAIYRVGTFTDFFLLESVFRLSDRGAVDLDRPLTDYARFPLHPRYCEIRVRDLLELQVARIDHDESLAFLARRFAWTSDARLALLSAVVENALAKPIEEIVRDEVVLPLRLRDTSFTPSADKMPRLAVRGEGFEGIYSSVEDCVKLFAASERLRASALIQHRRLRGVELDFATGQIYGGRRFLAFPPGERDFLLIFRNVTSWSQFKDFEFAAEVFAR